MEMESRPAEQTTTSSLHEALDIAAQQAIKARSGSESRETSVSSRAHSVASTTTSTGRSPTRWVRESQAHPRSPKRHTARTHRLLHISLAHTPPRHLRGRESPPFAARNHSTTILQTLTIALLAICAICTAQGPPANRSGPSEIQREIREQLPPGLSSARGSSRKQPSSGPSSNPSTEQESSDKRAATHASDFLDRMARNRERAEKEMAEESTRSTAGDGPRESFVTSRVIVEFSNPTNEVEFTRRELMDSIGLAARVYAEGGEKPRLDFMVIDSYRQSGPYKVAMHRDTARLILQNGAMEISQLAAEEPEDVLFDTHACDLQGRRMVPSAHAGRESQSDRWERQEQEFKERNDSNRAKTQKLYLDLPSGASTWSEQKHKAFDDSTRTTLLRELGAENVSIQQLTDVESGTQLNRKAAYVRFASEGQKHDAQLHKTRYLTSEPLGLIACKPAKATADAMGVKPCCLLPRCRGPSLCTAQRDAKTRWKAEHGLQQREESIFPPWLQEKKRKLDEKEREMQARKATLERAAQTLCARYLIGTCPRFVEWHGKCSRRHGSAEEAKKIQCCTSREPRPRTKQGELIACHFTSATCPYGGHLDEQND